MAFSRIIFTQANSWILSGLKNWGYLLLHIDPTKNTIEEDQIIASADELCAELFNEVATDVFQEAKREHFYPDADDDEIAEIRRRWQPYLDLLPEYRSSCRAFHTAE
jgi:hypothetical protein